MTLISELFSSQCFVNQSSPLASMGQKIFFSWWPAGWLQSWPPSPCRLRETRAGDPKGPSPVNRCCPENFRRILCNRCPKPETLHCWLEPFPSFGAVSRLTSPCTSAFSPKILAFINAQMLTLRTFHNVASSFSSLSYKGSPCTPKPRRGSRTPKKHRC